MDQHLLSKVGHWRNKQNNGSLSTVESWPLAEQTNGSTSTVKSRPWAKHKIGSTSTVKNWAIGRTNKWINEKNQRSELRNCFLVMLTSNVGAKTVGKYMVTMFK